MGHNAYYYLECSFSEFIFSKFAITTCAGIPDLPVRLCVFAYPILYCVHCANTEMSSSGWQGHSSLILLGRKTNM